MGERRAGSAEVRGSSPLGSTVLGVMLRLLTFVDLR